MGEHVSNQAYFLVAPGCVDIERYLHCCILAKAAWLAADTRYPRSSGTSLGRSIGPIAYKSFFDGCASLKAKLKIKMHFHKIDRLRQCPSPVTQS